MTILNNAEKVYLGTTPAVRIFAGEELVWGEPVAPPHWADQFGALYADYDASVAASITAVGGAVSAIASTGGPGAPLLQPSSAAQPRIDTHTINSLPALRVNSASAQTVEMANPILPAMTGCTIAIVCGWDGPLQSSYRCAYGDVLELYSYYNGNTWELYDAGSALSHGPVDAIPHVFIGLFRDRSIAGAHSEFWIDGIHHKVGVGSPGSLKLVRFSLGAALGYYHMTGVIGQATIFTDIISDPVGLSTVLKTKWGTP